MIDIWMLVAMIFPFLEVILHAYAHKEEIKMTSVGKFKLSHPKSWIKSDEIAKNKLLA